MSGIINSALFVITLTILHGSDGQHLTVDKTSAEPGDTLHFACEVTEFNPGELINWQKILDGAGIQFATNNKMEHKFDEMDKFTFKFVTGEDGAFTIYLNITDVTNADSGNYSCGNQANGVESRVEVSVLTDPSSISLHLDDTPVDEVPETEYDLNEEHSVKCVVEGSYPAPTVILMAGNTVISSSFKVTNELVVSEDPSGNKLQAGVSYKTTAEDGALVFDSRFAGRNTPLKCLGSIDGTDTAPLMKSFQPKFKGYLPIITCPFDEIVSYLYDTKVNITCTIDATPPIDMASISWRLRGEGENGTVVELKAGESEGQYSATQKEEDGQTKLILEIERMHPQNFREHTFTVSNSLGESSKGVLITRDKTRESLSGASSVYFSLIMSISCAILAALHL